MDLDPIGKHCALPSCNALDLLPIQCGCLKWFCKLHISSGFHDCPYLSSLQEFSSSSVQVLPKCNFLACNKISLPSRVAAVDFSAENDSRGAGCPGCHLSFCVDHRHMQSHSCTGNYVVGNDDTKHEVARAILAQKFSTINNPISHTPVVTRRQRNLPPDSPQLAQLRKVNLMKLRHKATPGDPKDKTCTISVEQRLHITVRLEIKGCSTKETVMWFRKSTITGKALDLIIQHFGMSHTTTALHLKQQLAEIGNRVLQNSLELSQQLEDGSTVVLTDSQSIK